MKKIDVSKRITVEFTEKELLAILYCLDKFFDKVKIKIKNAVSAGFMTKEEFEKINLAKNLTGLLKGYLDIDESVNS